MNKSQYHKYLKSEGWQVVRKHVLKRDEYKCRFCNSGLDLNVHHRSYEYLGRELQKLIDLITVCRRCHSHLHVIEPKVEPAGNEPKVKAKVRGTGAKIDNWGKVKAARNLKIHEELTVRRAEAEDSLKRFDVFTLSKSRLQLILTFQCGLTAVAAEYLGVDGSVSGWQRRAIGTTLKADRFIELMELSACREATQLDLH